MITVVQFSSVWAVLEGEGGRDYDPQSEVAPPPPNEILVNVFEPLG